MTATRGGQGLGISQIPTELLERIGISEISLEQLVASRNNPRRTMNEADLAELAASIREHGVNVPLLVRPGYRSVVVELEDGSTFDYLPMKREEASPYVLGTAPEFQGKKISSTSITDDFEIICGHRRSEAATLAGLESVPCIVRELTDEQAAEIALIDNLQRVDVPAMEEAEAFKTLLERVGSVAAVAAKVGKEQAYVAKRLKLCTLTCWSQDALRHKLITIDHALLLARLAEDEQNAALKWCLDRNAGSKTSVDKVIEQRLESIKGDIEDDGLSDDEYAENQESARPRWKHGWECESVLRLKEHIECESGIPLDRAPWDLDGELVISDTPACRTCEKNTKANAPLFGDLDLGVAVCTDGACFKEKTAAFVRIQSRLAEGVQAPLRVSWKSTSTAPRMEKDGSGPNPAQTFKSGQWIEANKKCEYRRPAVTVDWSDANQRGFMGSGELRKPGEVLQVCIEPKCKVHKKTYDKSGSSSQREERVSPEETKKLAEQREFLQKTENELRDKLLAAVLEKIDVSTAIRMVADQADGAHWRKKLLASFPKIAAGDRLEALAVFCHFFGDYFDANGYWLLQDCKLHRDGYFEAAKERPNVANDRKEAWELAKRVGLDADRIAIEYFREVGIAPAADCLWPKSAKSEKAAKNPPARKATAKPAAKKAGKKSTKKVAKKAGRK